MKLGEAMYNAAAGCRRRCRRRRGPSKKDDVVDAEFTEVDDDKDDKKSA